MVHIIAISDAWGTHYGGVSTLNYELCRAFAKNPNVKIVCVLPYIEDGYKIEENVHLVSIYKNNPTRNFSEGWELVLMQRFKELKIDVNAIGFCIGHDVITGKEAILLKNAIPNIKIIIFSHQAYELYNIVKSNSGEKAISKGDEQLNTYKQADVLLCVGPLLYNFFQGKDQLSRLKKENKIIEFIPGLPDVKVSQANPSSFSLMTMGRFEPETGDLKGINTVVKGFSLAYKEAKQSFGDSPSVTIFGLSPNQEINAQQSIDIIKTSSEISEKFIPINASPYTTDREALLNHVRNSSCLAMLSMHEGFGLVGWEAIACEIPLLLSQNSGLFKFLKNRRLENLVTSVELNRNNEDIYQAKEKIKEIATNPKNVKDDSVRLFSILKEEFRWDNVIARLLQKVEDIFESNRKVSGPIENISIATSNNSLEVVKQFYTSIINKDFHTAWSLLSHSFKNRGIWNDYSQFERGYSNLVQISNLRIFESVKAYSTVEYNVFYDDTREVPIEPIIEDMRFYTFSQKRVFLKKLDQLEKKLHSMNITLDRIQNLHLSQFFSPAIEDYLMFKLDLYDHFPRAQRKFRDMPCFYRCLLISENNTWKIDRILPVRFSDRT